MIPRRIIIDYNVTSYILQFKNLTFLKTIVYFCTQRYTYLFPETKKKKILNKSNQLVFSTYFNLLASIKFNSKEAVKTLLKSRV